MVNSDQHEVRRCVLGAFSEYRPSGVTDTLKTHLEDSLALLERNATHITELQEVNEYIEAEIRKTKFALSVFEDDAEITKALQNAERDDATEGDPDEIFCGKARLRDIESCKTQRAALYVIARVNDGHLDLNPASELIVVAELSKSTARVVSGNLHTYLSTNDDFEWVAPSQFRLKFNNEEALTTGDEMAQTERLKDAA